MIRPGRCAGARRPGSAGLVPVLAAVAPQQSVPEPGLVLPDADPGAGRLDPERVRAGHCGPGRRVIRSPSLPLAVIGIITSIGFLAGPVQAGTREGAGHPARLDSRHRSRSVAWKIVLQLATLPVPAWRCQCAERAMHRYALRSPGGRRRSCTPRPACGSQNRRRRPTCEYVSFDDCPGWQNRALVIASVRQGQAAARSRERGAPPPDQPGPRPAGRCSGREVNSRCHQAFTPGAPALLRQPNAQRLPEPPGHDRGTGTRRMRAALRWRGSGARTDTTHCPISAHPPQR
jgi:hypothetical protein